MINPASFPFTIALDMVERQAACVILQGMYSTTAPTEATTQLHGEKGWLVVPTPNMKLYEVDSPETFEKLIEHFTP